jgi:Pentapeptide repeats (8 copies)
MERLYKILTHDAQSAHGGKMDWTEYLPHYKWDKAYEKGEWIPGKWVSCKGELLMCSNGLHLTSHPLRWKVKKGRVFIAEYSGEFITENYSDKTCFRKIRLLAELGTDSLDLDVKIFKLINSFADLSSANLRSADLRSADLRYANLYSADLRSADLRYANLYSADLRSANLRYANLYSADLSSADLYSADLRSADLRSANLSSADLRYANLRSANLSSADLRSAITLEGVFIDNDPKIKGYKFLNGRLWKED